MRAVRSGGGAGAAAPPEHRNLPATAEAYDVVFDQWAARRKPATAIMAVRRGGETVSARAHDVDPLKPTLIASLSKPITGACIATLIRDGKLSFTTPLRDVMASSSSSSARRPTSG